MHCYVFRKLAQLGITIGDNEDNDNIQENNININSTHQGSNDSDYRYAVCFSHFHMTYVPLHSNQPRIPHPTK